MGRAFEFGSLYLAYPIWLGPGAVWTRVSDLSSLTEQRQKLHALAVPVPIPIPVSIPIPAPTPILIHIPIPIHPGVVLGRGVRWGWAGSFIYGCGGLAVNIYLLSYNSYCMLNVILPTVPVFRL